MNLSTTLPLILPCPPCSQHERTERGPERGDLHWHGCGPAGVHQGEKWAWRFGRTVGKVPLHVLSCQRVRLVPAWPPASACVSFCATHADPAAVLVPHLHTRTMLGGPPCPTTPNVSLPLPRPQGIANGSLTVGDAVLFVTLMQQLYGPLNFFGTCEGAHCNRSLCCA